MSNNTEFIIFPRPDYLDFVNPMDKNFYIIETIKNNQSYEGGTYPPNVIKIMGLGKPVYQRGYGPTEYYDSAKKWALLG